MDHEGFLPLGRALYFPHPSSLICHPSSWYFVLCLVSPVYLLKTSTSPNSSATRLFLILHRQVIMKVTTASLLILKRSGPLRLRIVFTPIIPNHLLWISVLAKGNKKLHG